MNTLIFIDLYRTLSNPFKPRGKRCKYYICSVFLMIVVTFLVIYGYWEQNNQFEFSLLNKIFLGFQTSMLLAALVSFGFVIKRLSMKGTSPELKKIILYRNAFYFIFYLFIGFVNALAQINTKEYGWGTNTSVSWPEEFS